MNPLQQLAQSDPEIFSIIQDEVLRQEGQLELIASENQVSPAILTACGSILTNKYAEGYPGARYYGGCEHVDQAEQLAMDRARSLFGADYANVQPHSGTQANMAVFWVLAKPGDTILSMDLAHGGHLSHGHMKNFSGQTYRFVHYGIDRDSERIDMEVVRRLAQEHKPRVLLAGASSYSRTIDFPAFAEIAKEVGATLFVDMAHIAGLVAAGVHPSPVPHADVVTFTTHKTLRGPRGGAILGREEMRRKINSAVFPGLQGGPLMHIIAAKATAFQEASTPAFRTYQERVAANARHLATALQSAGFRIVSGGTDNHLMLVDLRSKGISGAKAEDVLHRVHITVNKNLIPFDEKSAVETSGIRIGTPAITSRGMGKAEMDKLAAWIDRALSAPDDGAGLDKIGQEVRELCQKFPCYPGLAGEMQAMRGKAIKPA